MKQANFIRNKNYSLNRIKNGKHVKSVIVNKNFHNLSALEKMFFLSKCGDFVDMKVHCNETTILYSVNKAFYELCFCNVTNRPIYVQEIKAAKVIKDYVNPSGFSEDIFN